VGTPSRRSVNVSVVGTPPRPDVILSLEQLATAAGVSRTWVARLVRLGLIEPNTPEGTEFTAATAAQLRRMLRLHDDLGVNLTGAAIIVELLERLERLEAELARLRGGRA
jgi:chaperone modulatory protein CbpM